MNQAKTLSALLLALGASSTHAQWTLNPLWTLAPGDRSYLPATGDNNQRGMGYNPATGHILLTDRTGGTFIHILSAATGADLGTMNLGTGVISGGTFNLNMLRVADDGAIYAANLTTDSTATHLRIYRWANETATPTLAYDGDPSNNDTTLYTTASTSHNRRYGDNIDVRGSGANTQIMMASRAGKEVAIFTTSDGSSFTHTKVLTDAPAASMGLGVAFGVGNTMYGKQSGAAAVQVGFDLGTGVGTTSITYANVPTTVGPIGYDTSNNLLAGVNLNTTPNKDTVVLFDLSGGAASTQSDSKTYPLDQANGNGVGSVEFANGNLYALDVNNGIMAFSVVPEPGTLALGAVGLGALALAARRRE